VRWHSFEVHGSPVPQGSKRGIVNPSGKISMIESAGEKLGTWRQDVIGEARKALNGEGPIEGPVVLHVTFFLRTPQKPKFPLPIVRPDLDKLERALLDALQAAGMFRDDSQVVSKVGKKRYAYNSTPRVHIAVGEEAE
jgi:crossover junction endodeoxyribonuclease RusA